MYITYVCTYITYVCAYITYVYILYMYVYIYYTIYISHKRSHAFYFKNMSVMTKVFIKGEKKF